jgi:hypothetical protein
MSLVFGSIIIAWLAAIVGVCYLVWWFLFGK